MMHSIGGKWKNCFKLTTTRDQIQTEKGTFQTMFNLDGIELQKLFLTRKNMTKQWICGLSAASWQRWSIVLKITLSLLKMIILESINIWKIDMFFLGNHAIHCHLAPQRSKNKFPENSITLVNMTNSLKSMKTLDLFQSLTCHLSPQRIYSVIKSL